MSGWKKLQKGLVGPHLKLETQAEFEQNNSMELGFKGGPRQ